MRDVYRKLWQKFRYRIAHSSKFPKGDVTSFCLHLAEHGFTPNQIVDIGANKGRWSRKAAKVFPACSFTLIEPQIEMKPYLDAFCRKAENATWINAGVADGIGQLEFTVNPNTVSSSFTISEEAAARASFQRRTVPVITLDHLLEKHLDGVPEMVKIDAEGFECKIMQGATGLIDKTEVFLLEAPLVDPPDGWSSFHEIVAMMRDFGYEPFEFTGFCRMRSDAASRLCEIAFARRYGILRGGQQSRGAKRNAA